MESGTGITKIVVGVDGSEGAARAVRWAGRLAEATGAEVIAANALGSPIFTDGFSFMAGTAYEDWELAWKEWREHMVRTIERVWCRPLAQAGVRFRAEAVEGNAPEGLIELARTQSADLIVVGRRGRGGFAELVLGSTSHHLTHHSPTPVVVVPPST